MNPDEEQVERAKQRVEARYGAWTAHNLQLRGQVYTLSEGVAGGNEARLQRVVQLVASLSKRPIAELRVLDLGALEGLFAVEFARRGAQVVAIEAREANLEKIRLARDTLELDQLELRQEDAREISVATLGSFDVVLCLGLLYHLDAPAVFELLERMHELCRDVVVIDTHFALHPAAQHVHRGRGYLGAYAAEPTNGDPLSRDVLWSAVGNEQSFKPSKPSLVNALGDVGFAAVLECHLPPIRERHTDRATYAALKRQREEIVSVPAINEMPWERLAEPAAAAGGRLLPLRTLPTRLARRVRRPWRPPAPP